MAKGQERPALDDLDRRLMEVLQVDGRRPFTEIATAFAVPESTIRARYKALVDRGALKVIAVADPLKVGYPLMAMIGVRCTPAALLSTATALEALPEVSYCVVVAGAYDLLIEVVCEDKAVRIGETIWVNNTSAFVQFVMHRHYFRQRPESKTIVVHRAGTAAIDELHVFEQVRWKNNSVL